jgi:sestrin
LQRLTQGNDNWSIAELTHAVVLLAHFHSLASFVYGCGINAEVDQVDGHSFRSPSNGSSEGGKSPLSRSPHSLGGSHSSTQEMEGGIEMLMEKMRRLTEDAETEVTEEELLKRFERVETLSAECEFS